MRIVALLAMTAGVAIAAEAGQRAAIPPLFFENQGYAGSAARFVAKAANVTACFLPGKASFRVGRSLLETHFEGAGASLPEAARRISGEVNVLHGSPEKWRIGSPLFRGVIYRNLYPGIDLQYGARQQNLESEFVVAPGADPSRIRIRYRGGNPRIREDGSLVIPLDGGEFREQAPSAYQERDGARVGVPGRFALAGKVLSFVLGEYDRSLPLIIDPTLSYSTLIGGSGADAANAMAVDSNGAAYIVGFTESGNLPTFSAAQAANGGGVDAFVAKLGPGGGLVYCTYLGGSGDDRAFGVAVDSAGAAYVTGSTTSRNFPTRSPLQSKPAGSKNAFVLKLAPSGGALAYSTYLGGNGSNTGNGIAVDAAGNAYVVGDTDSINFPAGGLQSGNRGGQDVFLAKIAADGSRLAYSTYFGGANTDHGAAVAVDGLGSAYIAGWTWSADLPVAKAFQSTLAGGQDAFIARFNATGDALLFSSYLGGAGGILTYPETAQAIALDPVGNAYVAGVTSSADFPLRSPSQSSRRGSLDGFVAKVSAGGALAYSTYLGGSGVDVANAIAVDPPGNAYVAGYSYSRDLPVVQALQGANAGDCDAFLAKLDPAGALAYLSYFGGDGSDTAMGVAAGQGGDVYVAGWTLSSNFPLLNAQQTINAGNYGAFVAKLNLGAPPVAAGPAAPASGVGNSQTFSLSFSDSAGSADLRTVWAWFTPAAVSSAAASCMAYYDRLTNNVFLLNDAGDHWSNAPLGTGTLRNSQCSIDSGARAAMSGQNLTLTLPVSFTTAYAGAKGIWLYAAGAAGASGWQRAGSWTIPDPTPQTPVISASPNAGAGAAQTFTLTYGSTAGGADVRSAWVWLTPAFGVSGARACMAYYDRAADELRLLDDAGAAWMSAARGRAGAGLHNSQCSLDAASAAATVSGSTLSLVLPFTFLAPGNWQIWMYAAGGWSNSGWLNMGSWGYLNDEPATAAPITALPFAASQSTAPATSNAADPVHDCTGRADSRSVWFRYTADFTGALTLNTFGSNYDTVLAAYAGEAIPGPELACNNDANGTLQSAVSFAVASGQSYLIEAAGYGISSGGELKLSASALRLASLSPSARAAYGGGFVLTVNGSGFLPGAFFRWTPPGGGASTTLPSTFVSPAQLQASIPAELLTAAGTAEIAVWNGGPQSAVQPFVITAQPVAALPATPNAGAGNAQTFQFQYLDSAGSEDLKTVWVWFTSAFGSSSANSCMFYYDRVTDRVNLLDDAGNVWKSARRGPPGTLQNAQCAIDVGNTAVTLNGGVLTLSAPVSFKTPFAGVQQVWLYGAGGAGNSGWRQSGSWTAMGPVKILSVTPGAGNGASQTFSFAYADADGAGDLATVWAWFTPAFGSSSANSCMFYYDRAADRINLLDDAGKVWISAPRGALGTLQNSQCAIDVGHAKVTQDGGNLTFAAPVAFQAAYGGAKQIWMYAGGGSGNSGWRNMGTWSGP